MGRAMPAWLLCVFDKCVGVIESMVLEARWGMDR
jgi:hypothetical protein